jgi:hypothetical protein
MLTWGAKFGPHVEEVVRRTLDRYPIQKWATGLSSASAVC